MEKRAAKTSGSRPNPRNGSVPRDGHMSSSVTDRGPLPRNFNLHHEKGFRRSPTYSGRSSQTQKTWEASSSFSSSKSKNNTTVTMRRPKTHPELLNRDQWEYRSGTNNRVDLALGANKLLVNVTVARSIGPLRALLSKDATVEDAIKAILVLYAKEGRKPLLSNDPASFGLHYSQFCINCLNPGDKVEDLGSRTFFLWSKEAANKSVHGGDTTVTARSSLSSCRREIQSISRIIEPCYKQLMGLSSVVALVIMTCKISIGIWLEKFRSSQSKIKM